MAACVRLEAFDVSGQLSRPSATPSPFAQRLGDADTSSFIAAFKRPRGVPPCSYKRTLSGTQLGWDR